MRTKGEVLSFLESKLGTTVPCKGNPDLNGQCVTLIKSLLEFLGAPDPYKSRGHAKTVISAYLSDDVADPGTGFLSVFSNKNMGNGYGHIWVNAGDGDGTYYESNGQKALIVTKGKTYTYDNVCNLDKYIAEGENMDDKIVAILDKYNIDKNKDYAGRIAELDSKINEHVGTTWGGTKDQNGTLVNNNGGYLGAQNAKVAALEKQISSGSSQVLAEPPTTITFKDGSIWLRNGVQWSKDGLLGNYKQQ